MKKYSELDRGDEYLKRDQWMDAVKDGFRWRNRERFLSEHQEGDETVKKWEVINHKPSENGKVLVK